ncbi:hypothetical protein F5Y18DRAFT_440329 [Xylariaceae sp. FL1019]|nr:hypothetical protein F5Y18DRAFT_440329 [Xylariaceae sp. FL1019]
MRKLDENLVEQAPSNLSQRYDYQLVSISDDMWLSETSSVGQGDAISWHSKQKSLRPSLTNFFVLSLIISNIVFLFLWIQPFVLSEDNELREFYLTESTGRKFPNKVDTLWRDFDQRFEGDNITETKLNWEHLFPHGQGTVSLSEAEVIQMGLRPSMLDKDGKSLYLIGAFHDIHCLSFIYDLIRKSHNHENDYVADDRDWRHAYHCVGAIRQRIMCHPDTSLMGKLENAELGEGAVQRCANFEALKNWAGDHYTEGT